MKKPRLTTLRRASLVDLAHEQVLEMITVGEYQDGDRIKIDESAEQLGISRIPVREALARLHAEHLLAYERNKGYSVAPKTDYRTLFDARLILEPSAIRYCGQGVTRAQIRELRAINAKISKLATGAGFKQFVDFLILNDQFHLAVINICNNRLITEAYQVLSYGPQFARHTVGRGIPDLKDNVDEHERIIDALEAGDIEAAVAVAETHIREGLKRFETYWEDAGAS
ncbi:MAG TPA: GntR family transcriptional regulator [Gammaproteobacteria bacterium]|nr:GntR family transcriptional regulator [Gammaproteobacteria bacterium]